MQHSANIMTAIWRGSVLLVLLAFAYFIWPTRFEYHALGLAVVRVDRVTSTVDLLSREGWREMYRH